MNPTRLPLRHFLLALAVVAVWGTNFPIMKVATEHVPPLMIAALRFTFVLLPAVFFLKKPDVPWRQLAAYGLFIGVGQFGLIYYAVSGWISPGLASLVLQTQVFFTILLALWLRAEQLRGAQVAGLALASAGILVIALNVGGDATLFGIVLTLAAALGWAGGNIVAKAGGSANMLAYVVWAAMFSAVPLVVLSLVIDGPAAILQGFANADLPTWLAIFWQSVGNTLFGYAVWAWLLARYPAALIVPTALLVPVFGMGSSALWLGEPLQMWKIAAAILVIGGLALNMLWPQRAPAPSAPAG